MSRRAERVAQQLQHEIGALLLDGLKDPMVGFITITAVRVSPDLGHASIYYTAYGDAARRRRAGKGLESGVHWMRREIARRLGLKRVPVLEFRYDETLDEAARIDCLLEEVRQEPPPQPQDDPVAGPLPANGGEQESPT